MENIFAQYAKPLRSVMDYQADYDNQDLRREQLGAARRSNEIADLTATQTRQSMAESASERNILRQLAAQYGGDEQGFIRALGASGSPGLMKMAGEREKSALDRGKTTADTAKTDAETKALQAKAKYEAADRLAQKIGMVNTPDDLQAYEAEGIALGIFPAERRGYSLQQAQQMGGIEQWKAASAKAAVPVLEQFKTAAEMARAQLTADTSITTNAATNATSRANNDATVGATMQGQRSVAATAAAGRGVTLQVAGMVDRRARESAAAAMSKPFEVTGADGNPVLVQQDKAGNITPVSGYAPKGGTSKPLSPAVVKQVTEARDNAVTIDRLATSFKPEFAGKGVYGLGAEIQMSASGNVGVDRDAVDWWKNYRKQAELVERHALFGAALTPTEQASWRSADIGPGMDAKVVSKNLATRKDLAGKVADATRQDMIDAGHSEGRVNKIAGRGAPAPGTPPGAAPAKITDDAGYNALPAGATFIGPDGKTRRKP